MKRSILVFGTISGVIISSFMGISMAVMSCGSADKDGGRTSMIIGFAAMIAAFSFVFVGIKNYRDKQNGGIITFGRGFLLGFMISFIASTLYTLVWAVEFHFFMPDFMDKYSNMQAAELLGSDLSPAELEKAIKKIDTTNYNYKHNPFFFAMYTYMEILPVGILISLISAGILRRKVPALTEVQSEKNRKD